MTDEEMSMMVQEITMNVPKEESKMIRSVEAAEAWDVLTQEIAAIKAVGNEVEIPYDVPTVDVVDPAMIVEPVE
jgi:hypothetical protein